MFKLSRRPITFVSDVDDTGFEGLDPWIDAFVTELRASRAAGIACAGRARVSLAVAQRIRPEGLSVDPDLMTPLFQCSPENDSLECVLDPHLADGDDGQVIIE